MTDGDYEGHLDFAGCVFIGGWARDRRQPGVPVHVEISADGAVLATVAADETGSKCGFSCRVPWRLRDGRLHEINARIDGTEFWLPGAPRQIQCRFDITEPLPDGVLKRVTALSEQARLGASLPPIANPHVPPPMRIHIVCYEAINDWILGKIARRLREELERMGMAATVGDRADPGADMNHHIIYWGYVDRRMTAESVMITHIDNQRELNKVRQQLIDLDVDMGICMSFDAVHRLAHFGVPQNKLCFVNPAHDGVMRPRKIVVGITSRVYDDGCKREQLVAGLAESLPVDIFRFVIMGAGWERIVETMRGRGIEVQYHDAFDYETYCLLVPALDYYLYTGNDEGSMGFVDAAGAGVPTIVTPQGYHLDAAGGITHAFEGLDDLKRIFAQIAEDRNRRIRAVSQWTWQEYARKHACVWEYVLNSRAGISIPRPLVAQLQQMAVLIGT